MYLLERNPHGHGQTICTADALFGLFPALFNATLDDPSAFPVGSKRLFHRNTEIKSL